MKKLGVFFLMSALFACAVATDKRPLDAAQDQPAPDQEGVEPQTRGPVHEAFAAPQSLDVKPSPIVPKEPPAPVPEMPPDEKPDGSNVHWISGYWAWDDDTAQFLWVSGFWRDLPPGKRWVPGNWSQVNGGWQWTSGFWTAETQTEVNYLPPPPPTLETGPTVVAPAADQVYSPGCWMYVERQYRWRPGFWVKCQPNYVYVPAHYNWTPAGCVFVDAFWDYEIGRRGLLFCPIRFTLNVWTRPGWRLIPRFIVYPEVLLGALFVRPDYHRYCFGDYFGPTYVAHGFIPWVDYRLHANVPEPLFHQMAYHYRADANWGRDLHKLYDDRRVGLAPRPPRSFAQMEQFRRDLVEHKAIKVGAKSFAMDAKLADRRLMIGSPLAKMDRAVIPMKPLTPAARAEAIKTVEHHEAVKVERKAIEKKIVAGTPPLRPNDVHQVGKLPVVPEHLRTPVAVVRPAIPAAPAHIERAVPKYEPPRPAHASEKPLKH